MTIPQDFILMLPLTELKDCLFLHLTVIIIVISKVERGIHRINFILRVNITHFKVLIDGRNFYDQSVNSQIKKYDENPKIATEQRDDYTTGCLLDYQYFKDHYQLIVADLSTQKRIRC